MHEDTELLELSRQGDHEAFRQLVIRYKGRVFNAIYSVMGDAAESEDIAQEVFLKVYRYLGSFRHKSSFFTWLYRITVNECMDRLRKKSREKTVSLHAGLSREEQLKIEDVLQDKKQGAEDEMTGKELRGIVMKILGELPEKYRLILTLREIEGMSYDEIAQAMGISVACVRITLFRAREKLKEKIEGYETGKEK